MGNKLLFYLVVKPLSMLPFGVLYVISDGVKFLMYNLIGYRKKVVLKNLRGSFPEKSDKEIQKICSKFYSHFVDLILESVKMFSVKEASLKKRMVSVNSEVFTPYYEKGLDVIAVSGHYGNWEMWAAYGQQHMPHSTRGVYQPLKSEFWNQKAQKSRGKFGMNLTPRDKVREQFTEPHDPMAVLLLTDQSPHRGRKCYWTTFLGQETAMSFGMETLAKRHDVPVIYGDIQKIKRGHFEVTWTLISDTPNEHPHGWLTEKVAEKLEGKIREYPHLWLWTHRRWKRERRADEPLMNVLNTETVAHE